MRSISALALALVACAMACSGGASETIPQGSSTQFTSSIGIDTAQRLLVFVVDDRPTPEAVSLRATMVAALRATINDRLRAGTSWISTDSPRVDLRVVVVHPSVPGSAGIVGPSVDRALALVSNAASTLDVDTLTDAVAREVEAWVVPAGTPYAPLDATGQAVALVTGARAPADRREAALVQSLGQRTRVDFAVVTAGDDRDSTPVPDLAWASRARRSLDEVAVFTSLPSAAPCSHDLGVTRLGAWAKRLSQASPGGVGVLDASCPPDVEALSEGTLLHHVFADGFVSCLPSPPVRSTDGGDACAVTATVADDGPCAAHPGMTEPADTYGIHRRAPGAGQRVCEVERLTGRAADACRKSESCSGCTPGWCVAELHRTHVGCPTLRVVKGAIPVGAATFDLVCDLASP